MPTIFPTAMCPSSTSIKDRVYYHFGANKTEQAALAYRQKILQAEQERLKQK